MAATEQGTVTCTVCDEPWPCATSVHRSTCWACGRRCCAGCAAHAPAATMANATSPGWPR
jgi:hypothetical protein